MTLPDLAARCLKDGLASLSEVEVEQLRVLYLKEARKGAFRADEQAPASSLRAFCEHVQREFGPSVLTVIDCLPYFRQKAREQLGDSIPLAALILYATWIEHWLNVLITIGMLRAGSSEPEVEAYFDSRPRSKDKVERLAGLCRLPMPEKERGWLIQIVTTRARYHHYVWRGTDKSAIEKDFKGLTALVKKGEAALDMLLAFEVQEFDAPLAATANALFARP